MHVINHHINHSICNYVMFSIPWICETCGKKLNLTFNYSSHKCICFMTAKPWTHIPEEYI